MIGSSTSPPHPHLLIESPGVRALLEDLGRAGHARSGVPVAGAYDRGALRSANRLVGNAEGATGIECLLGGLCLTAAASCTVAITGATVSIAITEPPPAGGRQEFDEAVREPTRDAQMGLPITLPTGSRLRLGRPKDGLRTYVAVRGGLTVGAVLGSASTDTLSGLGPAPLASGDRLRIGPQRVTSSRLQPGRCHPLWEPSAAAAAAPGSAGPAPLRLSVGPHCDLDSDELAVLLETADWRVAADSDRVGLRLQSRPTTAATELAAALTRHARSNGPTPMFRGVVQLPPSGELIVMGPDCPTTGGYPIIAVVLDGDLDQLAQLRPGRSVRFQPG